MAIPLRNGWHEPQQAQCEVDRKEQSSMTKGKHGNKEAKKPKKARVPNPPGLPAGLTPIVANPLQGKKR